MIEFSDEMSLIDWISGGDLNMVGSRVSGGALFIDPVVLHIDPVINYITFKEAKG